MFQFMDKILLEPIPKTEITNQLPWPEAEVAVLLFQVPDNLNFRQKSPELPPYHKDNLLDQL